MLRATVHPTMRAVDPARWNAIGDDPWSAHAVLSALEDAGLPGVRLWAVTLEDAAGCWVAAAPLARLQVDGIKLTRGAFRRGIALARRVRPRFLETSLLICGTPLSVGNPPARLAKPADAPCVYARLAEVLDEVADAEGVPWRAFKELGATEVALAKDALEGRGWALAPSEPNATITIHWECYGDFLKSLRSHYRRKILLADRALARARIAVDAVPLAEAYDASIHALYESVVDRAAVQLERLTPEFFSGLGRARAADTSLIRFRRGDRVVGWVAMLFADGVAYDLFHGIDYGENEGSCLYFNQIAASIRHAIERGARILYLGQSSETAKARFGAEAVPLWTAVRHRNPIVSGALRAVRRQLFPPKPHPARRVFARRTPVAGGELP